MAYWDTGDNIWETRGKITRPHLTSALHFSEYQVYRYSAHGLRSVTAPGSPRHPLSIPRSSYFILAWTLQTPLTPSRISFIDGRLLSQQLAAVTLSGGGDGEGESAGRKRRWPLSESHGLAQRFPVLEKH